MRYFITPKAHLLRMVNLDTYYSVPLDKRDVQMSFNFGLIREELPAIEIFTADELKSLKDRENAFVARIKDYPRELYAKEMERLGINLSWKSNRRFVRR